MTEHGDQAVEEIGAILVATMLPAAEPRRPPQAVAASDLRVSSVPLFVGQPDLVVDPPAHVDRGVAPTPLMDPASPEDPHDRARSFGLRVVVEWVVIVGVAVALALLLKLLVVQSFAIPSESMYPTLTTGDRVLVNKLAYDAHDIHRGDVVVFRRPEGAPASGPNPPEDLIKRVIGLPGETITATNGVVFVNGRELREPYVAKGAVTLDLDPVTVPGGHIFVMGDNRQHSADSRVFGPVSEKLVIGRAFSRIWPASRVGFL